MAFIFDLTPDDANIERQKDREAQQRNQSAALLQHAIMGGTATAVGAIESSKNLAQRQQQFTSAQAQQASEFKQQMDFRTAERDRLWQQDDATRAAGADIYNGLQGQYNPDATAVAITNLGSQGADPNAAGSDAPGMVPQQHPGGASAAVPQQGGQLKPGKALMSAAVSASFLNDRIGALERQKSQAQAEYARAHEAADSAGALAEWQASPHAGQLGQQIVQTQSAIEDAKNQAAASRLSKNIPSVVQTMGLPPEQGDQWAQQLHDNPGSVADVQAQIHSMIAYHAADEVKKYDTERKASAIEQTMMQPSMVGVFPPEMENRMRVLPGMLRMGIVDPATEKNEVFNYLTTGNPRGTIGLQNTPDAFTRRINSGITSGLWSPQDAKDMLISDTRRRSGVDVAQKDPEAIGNARVDAAAATAAVKTAKEQLDDAQRASRDKPDDLDLKDKAENAMLRYQQTVRREGEKLGAKGAAEAGSKMKPSAAKTATDPKVQAAASALEQFRQRHMRTPDKTNPDDVAEMRSLAGG